MSFLSLVSAQPRLVWRFLAFFQTPCLRRLHAAVALLVFAQIAGGYAMTTLPLDGIVSKSAGRLLFWGHVGGGFTILVLGCALAATSLRHRGVRNFFPYLWGDTAQLMADMQKSLRFQLVSPRPKGLAAAVQGLGFGALGLTAFSGAIWLALWLSATEGTYLLKQGHVLFALLLQIYCVGHGGMALLHFVVWQRKSYSAAKKY